MPGDAFSNSSSLIQEIPPDNRGELIHRGEVDPEIDLGQSKADFDYRGEIERMNKEAAREGSQINIDDFPLKHSLVIDREDVDLALLQDAEKLIAAGKYDQALKKLDTFLSEKPGHPEATYLRALCLVSRKDGNAKSLSPQIRALQALKPLFPGAATPVPEALKDRVAVLRRRILMQARLKTLFLFIRKQESLYGEVDELRKLDPECPDYAFFTAVLLKEGERIEDAVEVIETCVRANGGKVPKTLSTLRTSLETQCVYRALQPAIRLLKSHDYSGARKILARAAPRLYEARDFQLFSIYTRKISGGAIGLLGRRRGLAQVKPAGDYADRDRVLGLLVREEITAAKAKMKAGKFAQAEEILKTARGFAPDYGFACYLLTACVYRRIAEDFIAYRTKDFKKAVLDLSACRQLLKTAADDPELASVKKLSDQVETLIRVMTDVERRLSRHRDEARRINEVIGEFKAVVDKANKGLNGPAAHGEIRDRLGQLKVRVSRVLGETESDKGKKALDDLAGHIDRNLATLATMNHDSVIVDKQVQFFRSMMGMVPDGGFRDRSALSRFRSTVETGLREAESAGQKVESAGARKALKQLEGKYREILDKISIS